MRGLERCVLVAISIWLAAATATADEIPDVDFGSVRLGVARFETAGPPGAELPDLAVMLADRIGAYGVGHLVGPDQLGAPAQTQMESSVVKTLSSTAKVDGIVVGRTTLIGNHLSVDVRLLSGASGDLVDTYIAEISRGGETASAIDTLSAQVVKGALALSNTSKQADGKSRKKDRSSTGVVHFDKSTPIAIKSDSLEAVLVDGGRKLVFVGNVRVSQADVELTSDRLTADYPKGSSQPSRLVATGSVRVLQGSQEARCDHGTYQRSEEVLTCCGNAELRNGNDRVWGSCIEFDLAGDRVLVKDAKVNIMPDSESGDSTGSGGDAR
jgi:lipopolysaccharide export system protein LptA